MVSFQTWTSIAFDLAADGVPPQDVISRASEVWRENKTTIVAASESEARRIGRRTL